MQVLVLDGSSLVSPPIDACCYLMFGRKLFTNCSRPSEWPPATVADVKYQHNIILNAEQDSVDVRLSTVQELPDLNRRVRALGR